VARRLIGIGVLTLASLLAAFGAAAMAKQRDQLKLTVPPRNTAGEGYQIHVHGFAVAPADTLTYYISEAGCPAAFHIPDSVGKQPGSLVVHPGKHGKKFSFTLEPTETTPALYHVCAYLIHGHKTYARATAKTDTTPL
jgi:hypothetical protein